MYARVCTHVCRQEEDVDVFPSPFFFETASYYVTLTGLEFAM